MFGAELRMGGGRSRGAGPSRAALAPCDSKSLPRAPNAGLESARGRPSPSERLIANSN